jgi:TolB-like protein/tetratricopeptide (TPR) repeat protein
MAQPNSGGKVCFGDFQLDVAAYELRCRDKPVRLERRAMDLLILLASRRGVMVSRDEIVEKLWGRDVFVDVESGVNTVVWKVRRALRDSSESPAFVETVSGKGYRFIAEVKAPKPQVVEPRSYTHPPRHIMVAVLPFRNLSGDPDQEYFSDGLTEETISCLGRINPQRMGVIARTTSMAYKGTSKSVRQIGTELGVDYVLESSARRENSRVRITSRLIRVHDQTPLWTSTYNREITGILDVQRELSTAIARSVRMKLPPEPLEALEQQQTHVAEAYDLYLRGRYFWNQLSALTTRRAVEFYAHATSLDPSYALAWSGLTDAFSANPVSGDAAPLEVWPLARNAAARAIAAAPDLAETQTSLGILKFWLDWDWTAAEAAFRHAIALNPSYALAHRMLGVCLSHLKRKEESLSAGHKARQLDPLNVTHHALSSQIAFAARDFAAAVEHARRAIAIDPEFWIGHMQLGQAHEQLGEIDLAIQALNNAARFSVGNSKAISLRGYILAKAGRRYEAEEVLHALEAASHERYVPPYSFALIQAGLGNNTLALERLAQCLDVHDVHLVFLTIDPKWDHLRNNRRFAAILSRCAFGTSSASG